MHGAPHQRLIRLRLLGPRPSGVEPAAIYRVAATWLVSDRPLPELAPFATPALPAGLEPGRPVDWGRREVERVVYSGPGLVAGAIRQVECLSLDQGWEVDLPDVCRLGVARDGAEVAVLESHPDLPPPLLAEALLGPGLILALAVHGVYCFHASAISTPRGVIAFLGETGRGKSTLARHLAAEPGPGWTRVADDILPAEPTLDGLAALPHFPQLKLPEGEQYPSAFPERLKMRAACVLAPNQDPVWTAVTLRPLAPLPASLALLRHTAAVRLFDRLLAAGHLDTCGRVAATGALHELRYPFSFQALPEIAAALAAATGR